MERRLAAILAADVVGYSRLMGGDETGTLTALKAHRAELIDGEIAEHHGRIVKLVGDGMLVEFASVVNALACATDIQRRMRLRNREVPEDRRIEFRVGINVGDVIVEGDDIFGDGVNVAARLESIAQPGGIAISGAAREHIGNKLDLTFDDLGEQTLKNIERPVRVYGVALGASSSRRAIAPGEGVEPSARKPSMAVPPFASISGEPEQGLHIAFGPFRLDQKRRVLLYDDEPTAVGRRGILILEALLRQAGKVLTKAELMDAGWPGIAVEESNLSVQVASLRKALDQTPGGGEWIATIPRVGYRFIGRLDHIDAAKPRPSQKQSTNVGGPSLAVLPFTNLSNDSDDAIFADGLTQDIITTLSKLPRMTVIARHSTFAYKGRWTDVRQVARELDVRYVLEGSIRRAANRVRIAVQLNDASTGGHVWAERYDRELADIFAIQDEISLRLANEMQIHLTEGEQARLRYITATNVEAWSYWVRGQAAAWSHGLGKDQMALARMYWEKALALDQDSASLNAILAFVHVQDARFRWWDDRETALAKATTYVERAFLLDPNNADAHAFASLIHLVKRQFDEAVALVRRAVDLAPGSADIAVTGCWVLTATGHASEAVLQIERAMKLNPNSPPVYYLTFLGNAYRLAGRPLEAIKALEEFCARAPPNGVRDLVLVYERAGRRNEAKGAAARLLAAQPEFTIRSWIAGQFRNDMAEFEADIAALRAVGLPE